MALRKVCSEDKQVPFPHCLSLGRRGGKNLGNQGLLGNPRASRPCWLLLLAPTRTQRLQVRFRVGGPGRWAPWGSVWGCRDPGCPPPSASALPVQNGASGCVPAPPLTPAPHLPARPSLPGSQLRALIMHSKRAEALAGLGPAGGAATW